MHVKKWDNPRNVPEVVQPHNKTFEAILAVATKCLTMQVQTTRLELINDCETAQVHPPKEPSCSCALSVFTESKSLLMRPTPSIYNEILYNHTTAAHKLFCYNRTIKLYISRRAILLYKTNDATRRSGRGVIAKVATWRLRCSNHQVLIIFVFHHGSSLHGIARGRKRRSTRKVGLTGSVTVIVVFADFGGRLDVRQTSSTVR